MSGRVIWITGIPGSGKSALAEALASHIDGAVVLRMDDLRRLATPRPTYSEEERDILYGSLVYAALSVARTGSDVIIDATANRRRWRDMARELAPGFVEIYLRCQLKTASQREQARVDTKGAPRDIYKKAAGGAPVPGVGVEYEEPLAAEVVIDSDRMRIEEEARIVMDALEAR